MIVKLNGYPITTYFHEVDSIHHFPHQGIDLAMPMHAPIPSVGDGVVTSITNEGHESFGQAIHVHMQDGNDAVYGHLSGYNVHVGQTVHQGDIIGFAGSTGHSTGPHLHLQIMHHGTAIDPTSYIQAESIGHSVSQLPWWDVQGHIHEHIMNALHQFGHELLIGLFHSLDIILPTVACVGILLWMVPFLPGSTKAPKMIGTSALLYMFYVLIRGAYGG